MRELLSFARPDIGEDEIAEVVDAMRSGWLTSGPKTRRFEADFVEFLGGGVEAVAVNSATAGLHLALEALGIGPGDEVITTTHTFTATAEVVRYVGADPVLVDVDPVTMNIDPQAILRAITPRTKAVIVVHYGGLSCDMGQIGSIAQAHGLRVIEDAAHALPATSAGRLVGSLDTDATVFSFYATKPVTTGEGGMLILRDVRLASRARAMRLHGIDRTAFERHTGEDASWYYEVIAPGFKYNMTDLAAAIGIHQLRKALTLQRHRQAIAQQYNAAFEDLDVILPPVPRAGELHAWHLYVLRLKRTASVDRDDLIAHMLRSGIECSVHYVPLHRQPYWRDRYSLNRADFPNSEALFETSVSLPIYTKMTSRDRLDVIDAVRIALKDRPG
jgi:dTDP-4-amino-4,6-dideoxygalactose transaminase